MLFLSSLELCEHGGVMMNDRNVRSMIPWVEIQALAFCKCYVLIESSVILFFHPQGSPGSVGFPGLKGKQGLQVSNINLS